MAIDKAEVLRKYEAGMSNAGPAWLNKIKKLRESPTAAAARAVDKYQRGTQRAVTEGTFVAGCNSTTLASYQQACTESSGNFAASSKKASRKFAEDLDARLSHAEQVSNEVQAMPSMTEADNENRMLHNMRRMREYKKRK